MWGKSRANTFSLWDRRGDRLYCSINSYNIGEGRMIRVWFLRSCIPRPSLVLSALSSLGHHTRDSQESSPTPQFKSITSSALSFLYGPTVTSIHDYWKNYSFG